MLANTQPADAWTFPFTPPPPDWKLDWDSLAESFSWLRALAGTPQEPEYHGEGDVFIHTRMVAEAMIALPSWHNLPASERSLLFASALLHDVGKPAMTHLAADGRISSRGHARKGELLTRRILCDGQELPPVALQAREYIARLVRFHGLPLRFLDSPTPSGA